MINIIKGKCGRGVYSHKTGMLWRDGKAGRSISLAWTSTSICSGSIYRQQGLPLSFHFIEKAFTNQDGTGPGQRKQMKEKHDHFHATLCLEETRLLCASRGLNLE